MHFSQYIINYWNDWSIILKHNWVSKLFIDSQGFAEELNGQNEFNFEEIANYKTIDDDFDIDIFYLIYSII